MVRNRLLFPRTGIQSLELTWWYVIVSNSDSVLLDGTRPTEGSRRSVTLDKRASKGRLREGGIPGHQQG